MFENEKWYIKNNKANADDLAKRLNISGRLAALLLTRAVCDVGGAEEFLTPDAGKFYDARLMADMNTALNLLTKAAAADKKVLVIGDYDVDGVMGAYILCSVFNKVFSSVSHCIPHRVDDGYGINTRIVEEAAGNGIELIVTCDNGISAHESIKLAKKYGIEVIVTDHHEVPVEGANADSEGYGVPQADAVVNPKRKDCAYPFKDLCGSMVAYKLARAFTEIAKIEVSGDEWDELFVFAAIATICDIVELTGENRRVVYFGLKKLNSSVRNRGLAELIDACKLANREITSQSVGFVLGPCINAAGRLNTAELSFGLLTQKDPGAVKIIVGEMMDLNRARQSITAEAYSVAADAVRKTFKYEDKIIVLYIPKMHESVSGIVAGRLKDIYLRPVIIFTDSPSGLLKGSGRSIEGFDLLECVSRARGSLEKYGGHSMAAGISIEKGKLDEFAAQINEKCELDEKMLAPKERDDLCVAAEDIGFGLLNDVNRLEPFGRGNPKPLLAVKNVSLEYAAVIGTNHNVVKIKLRPLGHIGTGCANGANGAGDANGAIRAVGANGQNNPNGASLIDAVFFGDTDVFARVLGLRADANGVLINSSLKPRYGGAPANRGLPVDVLFHLELSDYTGNLQLNVRSVRKAVDTLAHS